MRSPTSRRWPTSIARSARSATRSTSIRDGELTCAGSSSPGTSGLATRSSAGNCDSSRAPGSTPSRSACHATGSSASAISRTSPSAPSRLRAVPTRSTCGSTCIERATGNFTIGVGFSSTENFLVTASINEPNFLGVGNNLGIEVNTGEIQRSAVACRSCSRTSRPMASAGHWTSTSRTFNARLLGLGDYRLQLQGIGCASAFRTPRSTGCRQAWSTRPTPSCLARARCRSAILDHIAEFGDGERPFLGVLGWARDSRDSALTPSRGRLQRVNVETRSPRQELEYDKATYNHQWFYPAQQGLHAGAERDVGYGRWPGRQELPGVQELLRRRHRLRARLQSERLGPKDPVDDYCHRRRRDAAPPAPSSCFRCPAPATTAASGRSSSWTAATSARTVSTSATCATPSVSASTGCRRSDR